MKHRITRTPYRNVLARVQHPKPEAARKGTEPSGVGAAGPDGDYTFGDHCGSPQINRHRFERVGEADERKAWRCADCGVESDDCTADCCPRCGSCEPLEYR